MFFHLFIFLQISLSLCADDYVSIGDGVALVTLKKLITSFVVPWILGIIFSIISCCLCCCMTKREIIDYIPTNSISPTFNPILVNQSIQHVQIAQPTKDKSFLQAKSI